MTRTARPLHKIACIGEVMIELVTDADGRAAVGVAGDTFNTAVYLRRLLRGPETRVSYVTALGTDPYSQRILAAMRDHGLDADHVELRADRVPGLYAIDTDAAGERSFTYWRSNSAARTLFAEPCTVPLAALDGFDLVFLSGITMAILPPDMRRLLIDRIDRFRAAGGRFAYDSNHRPALWDSAEAAREINAALWSRADIALPSVDDEMHIFGDADEDAVVTRLRRLGVGSGALKRGAKGPRPLTGDAAPPPAPEPVRVVDSTSAGDSFNAGYLAGIAQGQEPQAAMRMGHDLAARVVQHRGAIIPQGAM